MDVGEENDDDDSAYGFLKFQTAILLMYTFQ